MLSHRALQSLAPQLRGQLSLVQNYRPYSGSSGKEIDDADLDAAREWYRGFSKSTIPVKLGQTTYSRSSGAGGQHVNKTNSKAMTVWPLHTLHSHVPKVVYRGLLDSRYYVASSDSINIQCSSSRSQTDNKDETHTRLYDEITQIYRKRVPGITSAAQKQKIEHLKKAENTMRLRAKKMHGDKKRSRSSGGNHGD
ncbi:hypothetical protein VTL71DRAFT_11500 [Oculimacula yallundae]|uniref:Prokaryotic-type class I peptide chain release factors domain-containing protein n=1 Tax=Oculimacula yallundae TaxID=86028 RepID=A0ABR4CQ93_9HELO